MSWSEEIKIKNFYLVSIWKTFSGLNIALTFSQFTLEKSLKNVFELLSRHKLDMI